MKPPLKWAGGKRFLLPQLTLQLPKFDDYYEPFLGGGALYFGLQFSRHSYLSDVNRPLIMFYRELRDHPKRLYRNIKKLWHNHNKDHYYYIREEFNKTQVDSKKSAYFYYLNKHGYNGLYRENQSGKFNVPIGRSNPSLPLVQEITLWSAHLFKTKLSAKDYTQINPTVNDFVYIDPPYMGTFDKYTSGGFTDHESLGQWCIDRANEGVYIMISNSDHPLSYELYKDFNITRVINRRTISQNVIQRKNVEELLIRSF